MPDEEVNVRVRQTGEGNALDAAAAKIDALKARIEELNRLEKTYNEKGITSAAASVRSERAPLEREMRGMQRQEMEHERSVTRERQSRQAIESARAARLQRFGNAAVDMAGTAAGGGGMGGMLPTGLMSNPAGIAAAVAVVVGTAVARSLGEASYQRRLGEMDDTAARKVDERRLFRLSGFEGSAGGARSAAEGSRDETIKLRAEREKLEEEAKAKWHKPSTWMPALLGTNREAINRNEEAIARSMGNEAKERELTKTKFTTEGALELEQQRARVEGRYKEAIAIDMAAQAIKRYKDLRTNGATEEQAREGADLVLRQREIDVQRGLGSLAGARDGRGNIAALASLGDGFSAAAAVERLDTLVGVVERGQRANTAASTLQTHRRN